MPAFFRIKEMIEKGEDKASRKGVVIYRKDEEINVSRW